MRVLWFVNVPLPSFEKSFGLPPFQKAGWLGGYSDALQKYTDVSLFVVTRYPGIPKKNVVCGRVMHYILPEYQPNERLYTLSNKCKDEYFDIIRTVKPDVIHFHGTEMHYGLLAADGELETPSVVSIQGLLSEHWPRHTGGLSFFEQLKSHSIRDLLNRRGMWFEMFKVKRRSIMELRIINSVKHIIGRTRWDRAHIRAVQPSACYHHCNELLRVPFYENQWNIHNARPFSIFVSTSWYALKGFHWVLRAIALIKEDFPEVSIRLADTPNGFSTSSYHKYLKKLAVDLGVYQNIQFIGKLDADGIVKELSTSYLYISPSLMENSSNSIAEAMLIGIPSVVSLAGGSCSMVRDSETALCYPPDDPAVLAECIRILFTNKSFAQELSVKARTVAKERHDYETVAKRLYSIYEIVIDNDLNHTYQSKVNAISTY